MQCNARTGSAPAEWFKVHISFLSDVRKRVTPPQNTPPFSAQVSLLGRQYVFSSIEKSLYGAGRQAALNPQTSLAHGYPIIPRGPNMTCRTSCRKKRILAARSNWPPFMAFDCPDFECPIFSIPRMGWECEALYNVNKVNIPISSVCCSHFIIICLHYSFLKASPLCTKVSFFAPPPHCSTTDSIDRQRCRATKPYMWTLLT